MYKNNIEIDEIENRIIVALLKGDDPVLHTLRDQLDNSKITNRELSGSGIFTHFSVPESCQKVAPPNFVIDDVYLEIEGIENGASAMLFIKNGKIDFLEVVAITGEWPDNPILKSLHYFTKKPRKDSVVELIPTQERDLDVTKLAWIKKDYPIIDT